MTFHKDTFHQKTKTYTADFGAVYIEARNDEEADRIALETADKEHALWKDDIGEVREVDEEDNEAEPPYKTYMIDWSGRSIEAKNDDEAIKKANKFAKAHNLEFIEIDEGYED